MVVFNRSGVEQIGEDGESYQNGPVSPQLGVAVAPDHTPVLSEVVTTPVRTARNAVRPPKSRIGTSNP